MCPHLPSLIEGSWILIGDFNLVRSADDKNNGNFNQALAAAFNDTIQDLNISELHLKDRLFTWSNQRTTPILARLDRAFSNYEHSLVFPSATLSSLPRPTSDHTPILLTMCTSVPKTSIFRLENAWLKTQHLPSFGSPGLAASSSLR